MTQALQDVIEHRRTTNVFEPNHTISDEQIEHLVHLATRAPTSFNLQNWRFLAVRTPERKAKQTCVRSGEDKRGRRTGRVEAPIVYI
jgi:nitroreductase